MKKENKDIKRNEEKQILTFDTNAIIYSIQKKIDILETLNKKIRSTESTIVIPSGIYNELEKIINSKASSLSEKRNATIALKIIQKWEKDGKINVEKADPPLDRWFIKIAKKQKLSIVTYDKKLKQYLKRLGAQIIMLRD
ncbi:MAG: PIN domain-containing protein [Candidatus Micrarchaeia archaeon]